MKDIVISVLIPMYNVEHYIDKCLDSILSKRVPQELYEVILVDDGSTDRTYEIAENRVKDIKNVSLFRQTNQGVSSARNKGLEKAGGKFIMFVDSDDFISVHALESLIEFVSVNSGKIDILHYDVNIIKENQPCNYTETFSEEPISYASKEKYLLDHFFSKTIWNIEMWRFLFKSSLIRENNICFKNDISMGEDQLFTLEALRLAEKITYVPWKVYNYIIKKSSVMSNFHYKHAISQLNTASRINEIIKNSTLPEHAPEGLFYKRFVNIFVIYQYIDRILCDKSIKRPIETIKKDIKIFNLGNLYLIPYYPEEVKKVRVYNFSLSLYVKGIQIKKFLIKMLS